MPPEILQVRALRIRWPNRAIALATGLAEMTIGRTLTRSTSPNYATINKIEAAVVAEEIRLRDYLLALHPVVSTSEAAE